MARKRKCTKKRYKRGEARRAARYLSDKLSSEMSFYPCNKCKGWYHVGNTPSYFYGWRQAKKKDLTLK